MKKLLFALLAIPFLLVGGVVSAQTVDPFESICQGEVEDSSVCNVDGSNDPIAGQEGVIIRTVTILSYIVGFASVLMVMVGGLKFITANGDPNSVSSARNTVLYALIGVVVFLSSQLIVRFVVSRL